jgi:hypothetical protein
MVRIKIEYEELHCPRGHGVYVCKVRTDGWNDPHFCDRCGHVLVDKPPLTVPEVAILANQVMAMSRK